MGWIYIEGIDRTGKSTVAEFYKKRGYDIVHVSAPDKKYFQEGYSGPSYFEDYVEMLTQYQNKDVVFDRGEVGELVWSKIYNRKPQLTEEDIEYIREMQKENDTQYIMMHDKNTEAHWNRCVANKEPLTRAQFDAATTLFYGVASAYKFTLMTLPEFLSSQQENEVKEPEQVQQSPAQSKEQKLSFEQEKLMRANAINDLLTSRLIPKTGKFYDDLENELRAYLNGKLGEIFGKPSISLDPDDIEILKAMCQQLRNKAKK